MASTLVMSSAVNGWIGGGIAHAAQSAGAAPAGSTKTVPTRQQASTPADPTTTSPGDTTEPRLGSATPGCSLAGAATKQPPARNDAKSSTKQTCSQRHNSAPDNKRSHRSSGKDKNVDGGTGAKRKSASDGSPASDSKTSRSDGALQSPVTSPSGSATATEPRATSVATNAFSAGVGVEATSLGSLAQVIGSGGFPPNGLIPIYKAAGREYHIPWQVLAAINGIETNYGRNLSVSPAGAIGWMQFMPATWSKYAVPVAGQAKPSPYDPRAAIFAAAHLLAANGGAAHLRQAIYAYNHASWYVDAVLWREQLITDWAAKDQRAGSLGYALPLDGKYMRQLGRTDEGVDIETAPDGAAVYSITAGTVTAVASDPTGFGPDYPVIHVTSGPLAGHDIYYGHVAASLVHVGQHVAAGQPIAVMGHTGDAASLGHGHIEIGFSDATGDPLDHPGTTATPSGSAMRSFLIELSGAFGIHNS
jgi:membrane-bound lytic murein transglycosylase B